MDIKLKKSNVNWNGNGSRLAVLFVAVMICAASFSGAVTVGMTSIIKIADLGDPLAMLSAKEYEDSGLMEDSMSNYFNDIVYTAQNPEAHEYSQLTTAMEKLGVFFYIEMDDASVLTNMDFGGERPATEWLIERGNAAGAYRSFENLNFSGKPEVYRSRSQYSADDWLNNTMNQYASGGITLHRSSSADNMELQTVNVKLQRAYIELSRDYVQRAEEGYQVQRERLLQAAGLTGGLTLVCLASFILLCVMSGKRDESGRYVLRGIDRWFTELLLALLIAAGFCAVGTQFMGYDGMVLTRYTSDYYTAFQSTQMDINMFGVGVCAAVLYAWAVLGLVLILAMVKKIKAGRFFRDFFIVKICSWIWGGLKDIYYGSSIMKKVILLVALMCLCSATIVFFPVVVVVSLVFASKWVKQYEAIKKGVLEVKNGNPAYKITVEGDSKAELVQLAADINAISEGFNVAVKQELKNQRMKTELISNVSHDIKTPLTSIITYVDLLKKEGLDCEEAPKYLDILDQKSTRLRKLTEDLFEAAKASSGDIPVNLEQVDLMYLLSQTLGELSDRLGSKGLDVIVKAEKEKFCVAADGQLLWRVLENLFGNAVKYALENSRVYVDIHEEQMYSDGRMAAVLEMKNISKNPLNIPAEELMERFKRGDESRSTEGSGLGLSIARDLVTMQHGRFDLVIDGDLFKAVIMLEVCQ